MYSRRLISAIFLVAGTCIGGGMLALPVATAGGGFIPSIWMMFFCFLAMTMTALFFIEIGFWMKKDQAHVITMASTILGKPGKWISWLVYLFICYASLIAYTAGGGHLLAKMLSLSSSFEFSKNFGCIVFILLFGPFVWTSHKILGRVNAWLFIAMIIAYVFLTFFCAPTIHFEYLERKDWSKSFIALPILLTAFSFQTMVPSLHPYLNHHGPSLRIAIVAGTFLAFCIYFVWQLTVFGNVPYVGPNSLMVAVKEGTAATEFLSRATQNPWVESLALCFAFFALVTSFFGMSMGLFDFLSDGLKISKRGKGSIILTSLVLLPTLFCAIFFERIFLHALDLSGGFGDSILNGLLPIAMIFVGRYILRNSSSFHIGKKPLLVATALFFLLILGVEVLIRIGHLSYFHDYDAMDELVFSDQENVFSKE